MTASFEIILETVNILYVLKFQIKLVNTYLVTVNMSWCWCKNFILTTRNPWFRIFIFSSNTLLRKFLYEPQMYTPYINAAGMLLYKWKVHNEKIEILFFCNLFCRKVSSSAGFNSFSIQSCRSCYATLHRCQRPFYKIFVKFRNSKKMYLKLF
jgi:hypothetical protein